MTNEETIELLQEVNSFISNSINNSNPPPSEGVLFVPMQMIEQNVNRIQNCKNIIDWKNG